MLGLGKREVQFAAMISGTHWMQHFLSKLLPPLIPILAVALQFPLWKLGLLLSVQKLGSGFGQAPLGVLSDRYDRRYLLPTGIAVGGASYLLFVSAPVIGAAVPGVSLLGYVLAGEFLVMSTAMFVLGVGTAVVHPTAYPLITANVSENNKGKVLGMFGSSSKVGDATAPAVIGVLSLLIGWSEILMILGVIGVVYGAGLFVALRSDAYDTVPADRTGADDDGDGSDENTSESIWEADRRTYMYPLLAIYLFFITKKFASNGITSFFPVFVVGVYAYSFEFMGTAFAPESVANFYFSFLLLVGAATQLFLGGMTDRHDPRAVLLGCVGVATVGLVMLSSFTLTPVLLALVVLVLGAGLWGVNPARDALISDITPPEREGRTFGYIWTAVQITGAGVPVVVGYIMETIGLRQGFMVLSIGTVLAGVSIALLYADRVYVADPDRIASMGSSD